MEDGRIPEVGPILQMCQHRLELRAARQGRRGGRRRRRGVRRVVFEFCSLPVCVSRFSEAETHQDLCGVLQFLSGTTYVGALVSSP